MRAASALLLAIAAAPVAVAQKCLGLGSKNPIYAIATPQPLAANYNSSVAAPWAPQACCTQKYTYDLATYGVEYLYQNYSFHHCNARNSTQPRMSKKCEQFMLWEEAFYACDPYLGYFDPLGTTYASQAPLCRSFCNSWYDACKDDYSCVRDWINDWNYTDPTVIKCPDNAPCKKFSDWYHNGTEMCTAMWGDAFSVPASTTECLSPWFWSQPNPNSWAARRSSDAPSSPSISLIAAGAALGGVLLGFVGGNRAKACC